MGQEYYIGQIFDGIYPPEAANWCNNNNATIEEKHRLEDDADVRYYEICAIPEPPVPTHDEQSEKRALAYQNEVDPITAHISRLRDAEQTEEVVVEIAELIAERDAKVEEIKARYPYPTDPIIEKIA